MKSSKKKRAILLFTLLGLVLAGIVITHENPGPLADPTEELIKKVIACTIIGSLPGVCTAVR